MAMTGSTRKVKSFKAQRSASVPQADWKWPCIGVHVAPRFRSQAKDWPYMCAQLGSLTTTSTHQLPVVITSTRRLTVRGVKRS